MAAPPTKRIPLDRTEHARAAARARWGAPRRIKVDHLTDPQRWALARLVDALPADAKAVAK